jgi:hypothetical protein
MGVERQEHRWAKLSPAEQDLVRTTSRTLLGDITLNRLTAQFTEDEFQLLERAANGEPINLTERLRLQQKYIAALTAQTDAMEAFLDHLRALGWPADMALGAFCAERGVPIPEDMPDLLTFRPSAARQAAALKGNSRR